MKLKIAIVVHGRFHAFDLARELLKRGHDVTLFTNYPKWAVKRFGISGGHVKSFWTHGILSRVLKFLHKKMKFSFPEAWLHEVFGRWAVEQINREKWNVVHSWSGISEEVQHHQAKGRLEILMRGSAHIRTQARILDEEEGRVGVPVEKPSPWIIAREEKEYDLADRIVVLSTFARESFITEGFPKEKLSLLPMGAQTKTFRPSAEVIERRCQRILSGDPLQILYVGALSFRKGMWDMVQIIQKLDSEQFHFQLIGAMDSEVKRFFARPKLQAEIISKRPQHELPRWYAEGDLFVFPTLEDGFAVVLAQAQAAGLLILTTTNCAGPDMISEGETGWVLPIRSPETFIGRLEWCDTHREALAKMILKIYDKFRPRDWADVAADFEKICSENLETNE